MNAFSRSKKHISMDRVKKMHEEKYQRQLLAEKKEEKRQNKIQEIVKSEAVDWRSEFTVKVKEEAPVEVKSSDWRKAINTERKSHHIKEGMTTQNYMTTSLPATGDLVNYEIAVNDVAEMDPQFSGAVDTADGKFETVPYDYNIASGAFNGAMASGFTFNPPFNSPGDQRTSYRRGYSYYSQTTNPFKVTDDTLTLKAIAGNSIGNGLGSNGATQPYHDLDLFYLEVDDEGNFLSSGELGVIPRTTHSVTEFEFKIPDELFDKNIQVFMYSNDSSDATQWWLGSPVSFHPEPVTADTKNYFHGLLNKDILPPESGFPETDDTTMAYIIWSRMQRAKYGDAWSDEGSGIQGYPAPVSGGTRPFESDENGNPTPQSFTMADANYIVNYVRSAFRQYKGMTTTKWGITNLQFKRQTPKTVFVSLDSPEASSFVRSDPFGSKLSAKERRKRLEKMLKAGDKYMQQVLGMDGSNTQIADTGDVTPWKGNPNPYDNWDNASPNPYDSSGQPDIPSSVPFTGLSPEDLKSISDRVGGSYSGGKSDTKVAASYPKKDPLDKLLKDIDDADKKIPPANDPLPPNRRGMGDRWKGAQGDSDTKIASARGPYGTPGADKPYTRKGYKDKDGKFVDFDNPATWPKIPKASKGGDTMVAHYEPPKGKLVFAEMMTTASLMTQELSAQGDRNLKTVSNSVDSRGSNPGAGGGNGNYNFGPVDDVSLGSSVALTGTIDTERYDTLKFNFTAGTIDTFYAVTSSGSTYRFSATSGPKALKFNANDRNNKSIQMAFYVQNGGPEDKPIGNTFIRNLSYQRRSNIVLNLSLDDPDASGFIRGGIGGSKQRRQNLKNMLDSGNEWMAKNKLSPSKTSPGDIKLAGWGLRPDGTQGLNMPGDIVPDHNGNLLKLVPDPSRGRGFNRWVPVKKAGGGGGTMVAHYEPQGKVISEKKKLKSVKDVAKRIPGYYDGKPSPTGFPMEPPPKLVKLQHPELTSGDRASKRYNKLDPASAKAMPKTAYSKIDKKVQHAAWKEDWRKEFIDGKRRCFTEGMTTQALGMINLDGEPDVIQDAMPSTTISQADNIAPPDSEGVTVRSQAFQAVDATRTDTLTFNISGNFGNKTVSGYDLNDRVWIGVLVNGTYVGNYLAKALGNGTHQIAIPPRFRKPGVVFDAIQVTAFQGGEGHQSSTVNITAIGTKRVNPMNLFVGLDDPEANSFVRSGLDNLSAEERRKRLAEILKGGSEYMKQQLDMDWSADIADTGVVQPWEQAAAEYPEDEWNQEDEMLLQWLQQGGLPGADTEKDIERLLQRKSRYGGGFSSKNKDVQVAHYEPEGDVISEKKRLKSPSGFPETPPPKMINGFHPDLVTGDRAAKRFNKLDPTSAKAMPKTAYPHIDKKVRAAAKKPK